MKKLIYMLALSLLLTACNNGQVNNINNQSNNTNTTVNTEKEASSSPVKKVASESEYASLKVNELGEIPVLMYHGLVEENPPSYYQRRIVDFKADLQYLYDNKYRLISMKDYVSNNINVEPGYTPVVITFDDGEPTDFSLVEKDGKLVSTPDCAIDIIEKFAAKHPDFGKAAIININGGESQLSGAGTYKERLNYLIDNGFEIGNHTYSHEAMSKLSADEIQEEIGRLNAEIKEALPNYTVPILAYPLGIRPQTDELKKIAQDGEYKGTKYHMDITFREGPSVPKLYPTIHTKFDPLNAPRLRGNDTDEDGADMGGYMKMYEKHPERRYVSDGDPNTIVVPKGEEENISKGKIGDKIVVTY